ncbi:hypothetical protein [Clostridium sp.]|jgi:hypothetical protein|uniref:hypothetical protein n=1 Tax=Clostridium sp. TaxID=1506 RepID=UPI00258FA36D|nr:hypothetical protein [Clostridium sp.]MDF2505214.1 hypothetical protein [Clostridium sp.]
MSSTLILRIVEIILGIILNIFIGKISRFIFKKDGTGPRIPLRIAGIWLLINGLSGIMNINIF